MNLQVLRANKSVCCVSPKAGSGRLSHQGWSSLAGGKGENSSMSNVDGSCHLARQLVTCQGSAGYTRRSLIASAADQEYAEQGFTEPWSIYDNPLLYEAAFLRDFESEVLKKDREELQRENQFAYIFNI